jgi:hypothetical protein
MIATAGELSRFVCYEVEVLMPEEEEEAAPCLARATGGAQAAVPTSLRPR